MKRAAFVVLLLSFCCFIGMGLAHHFAHLAVSVNHDVQALHAWHDAASVKGVGGSVASVLISCCGVDASCSQLADVEEEIPSLGIIIGLYGASGHIQVAVGVAHVIEGFSILG